MLCLICCFYTTHNKVVTKCKKWGFGVDIHKLAGKMTTSKQIYGGFENGQAKVRTNQKCSTLHAATI